MSNYAQSNGDDYPDAAFKNLQDALALFDKSRYDGAGYHAGYVIECVLKTLLQAENACILKHNLNDLSVKVARLATTGNSTTARYISASSLTLQYDTPPNGWKETMRYRAEGDLDHTTAKAWIEEAQQLYRAIVQEMRKDGVIT